jgi:hypothetical protein
MTLDKRRHVYLAQTGRRQVTRRQWRRIKKKAWRDEKGDPAATRCQECGDHTEFGDDPSPTTCAMCAKKFSDSSP